MEQTVPLRHLPPSKSLFLMVGEEFWGHYVVKRPSVWRMQRYGGESFRTFAALKNLNRE